jgi:sugar lactone lactonase YvrE
VLADGQLGPTSIRAYGSDLYWSNNLGGTIMRMPKVGGTPVPIAENQASPAGMAVDAVAVYWVNIDDGRVMAVAR